MTKRRAYVEVRSQKSRGGISPGSFGGPDTYVMVQIVPEGVDRLKALNHSVAEKRGIELVYFGQGYRMRQASGRSMLSRAIAEAEDFADSFNREEEEKQHAESH